MPSGASRSRRRRTPRPGRSRGRPGDRGACPRSARTPPCRSRSGCARGCRPARTASARGRRSPGRCRHGRRGGRERRPRRSCGAARLLEDLEHLDARQRRLEAAVLQFVGVGHGVRSAGAQGRADRIVSSYELGRRLDGRPARTPMTTTLPSRLLAPRRRARSPLVDRRARRLPVAAERRRASSACSRPTGWRSCRATSSPASRSAVDPSPGLTPRPGARRARLAAAGRPVPCRSLGLRLHDPPPGRRAAAAPGRRPFKGDVLESIDTGGAACRASASSSPRSPPSRLAPRAFARPHRGADQGLAGAGEAAAAGAGAAGAAAQLPAARAAPMTGAGRPRRASPSPAPRVGWARR